MIILIGGKRRHLRAKSSQLGFYLIPISPPLQFAWLPAFSLTGSEAQVGSNGILVALNPNSQPGDSNLLDKGHVSFCGSRPSFNDIFVALSLVACFANPVKTIMMSYNYNIFHLYDMTQAKERKTPTSTNLRKKEAD